MSENVKRADEVARTADGFQSIKELTAQHLHVSLDATMLPLLVGAIPEDTLDKKLLDLTDRADKLRKYNHIQIK